MPLIPHSRLSSYCLLHYNVRYGIITFIRTYGRATDYLFRMEEVSRSNDELSKHSQHLEHDVLLLKVNASGQHNMIRCTVMWYNMISYYVIRYCLAWHHKWIISSVPVPVPITPSNSITGAHIFPYCEEGWQRLWIRIRNRWVRYNWHVQEEHVRISWRTTRSDRIRTYRFFDLLSPLTYRHLMSNISFLPQYLVWTFSFLFLVLTFCPILTLLCLRVRSLLRPYISVVSYRLPLGKLKSFADLSVEISHSLFHFVIFFLSCSGHRMKSFFRQLLRRTKRVVHERWNGGRYFMLSVR